MKLKYSFDAVNMGDEIISVPVGEGADQLHGVIKLNQSGHEILELLKEEITEDAIVDILASKYDNKKEDIRDYVKHIIDILYNEGIIEI